MSFFKEYLDEQLKDPEFKRHWDESKPEYEVARQIIRLRKERGLTQQQLARRLRTKQSAISRIENGDQNISLSQLKKIANALGGEVEIKFKTPK